MRLDAKGLHVGDSIVEAALRQLYRDYLRSLPETEHVARALMDDDFERWTLDLLERNATDMVASCVAPGDCLVPQVREKLQRQVIDWVHDHKERLGV